MSYIIGTMSWGAWGKKWSPTEMSHFLSHTYHEGFNAFDMADIYGDHTTEQDFGQAWKLSNISRNKLAYITKAGIVMEKFSADGRTKHYNHTKEYIIQSCEKSLQNLQTDYLDVFLIHRPGPLMSYHDIAEAAMRLIESGKILKFGVSNFTASQLDTMSNLIDIHCNQIECSLRHYTPMLNGDLDVCIKNQIQPMAWAPLGKIFSEKSEENDRILPTLEKLAEKYGCPPELLLYHWLIKHPSKILPVVGTTNEERISALNTYQHVELEQIDWYALWTAALGRRVP